MALDAAKLPSIWRDLRNAMQVRQVALTGLRSGRLVHSYNIRLVYIAQSNSLSTDHSRLDAWYAGSMETPN